MGKPHQNYNTQLTDKWQSVAYLTKAKPIHPGFRSRKGIKKQRFAIFAPLFTPLNTILWSGAGGFNRGGSNLKNN